MTKAFAYLRVSGLGQTAEGKDGFTRQLTAIQESAAQNGFDVVRVFEERGVSGKNDHDSRPAMREMLGELGEVQTVIVERLDRLARDLIVQEGIIAKLREKGATLVSSAEPDLCSDDPSRKFIRQVLGAVAELDRNLTVHKLRAARARRKEADGKCEGRKAFGERAGESDAVLRMAELRRHGYTWQQIAAAMNQQGIATRCGGTWHPATVRKIVERGRGHVPA